MKKVLQNLHGEHKVTWLELFYDLVYVVVIARLAHLVTHGHNGHIGVTEFLVFVALFIPVWWAWTGHTLYSTRFYDDSPVERLLTLSQMFLITMLAVFINDAFHGEGAMFALIYALIRSLLVMMYVRVYLLNKELRPVSACLAGGFSLGAGCWWVSVFLPPPWMYVLWFTGLLIDFITPIAGRPYLKKAGVHRHHLPERFGLLVIILLGESVASLMSALTSRELSYEVMFIAVMGFISLSAIWWHYFEVIENLVIDRDLGAGQLFIYGHLPILIGLALLASAIRQNIVTTLSIPDITVVFTVSITLYLLPVLAIVQPWQDTNTKRIFRRNTIVLLMLLAATVLIRHQLTAMSISAILAGCLALYVYLNQRQAVFTSPSAQQ